MVAFVEESTMSAKSVWFPRAGAVELRTERIEPVGPTEIRVHAIASAISHGTELLVYRGQVSPSLPLDLPSFEGGYGFPIKYGYASVGKIVEVGSSVDGPTVGDTVFVHHPHQSEYVVEAKRAVRLPPDVDPEDGVFLANLETALNVTLDAHPRLGDRVAIFGQGVVGLLLTQLLKRAGAGLVVVVDPVPIRSELAQSLGADAALTPGEHLADAILDLTDGQGMDLAVEASGNPAALDLAIQSVGFGGTVVVCSWYGTKPVPLMLGGTFHRGRIRLVSSQVGTVDSAIQPRWSTERRLHLACDLLSQICLKPLITHRIPLERAADAYELLDCHPDDMIQVVFTYG